MKENQKRKTPELTFDEICELEPHVEIAYRLAKMIGRKRDEAFCANFIYYHFLKPILNEVIGYGRPRHIKRFPLQSSNVLATKKIDDSEPDKRIIRASNSNDPRLYYSSTYEVASKKIYEALPDCNHDGRC